MKSELQRLWNLANDVSRYVSMRDDCGDLPGDGADRKFANQRIAELLPNTPEVANAAMAADPTAKAEIVILQEAIGAYINGAGTLQAVGDAQLAMKVAASDGPAFVGKKLTCDEAMAIAMQNDDDARESWTAEKFAQHTGKSAGTVKGCKTWKGLMAYRGGLRLERGQPSDRRRKSRNS